MITTTVPSAGGVSKLLPYGNVTPFVALFCILLYTIIERQRNVRSQRGTELSEPSEAKRLFLHT